MNTINGPFASYFSPRGFTKIKFSYYIIDNNMQKIFNIKNNRKNRFDFDTLHKRMFIVFPNLTPFVNIF